MLVFLPDSLTDKPWFTIVCRLAFSLTTALWVAADAQAHRFAEERVKLYTAFSGGLPELAVPVYLVKSRGWKGAANTSLRFAVIVFIAASAIILLGSVAKLLGISVPL